MILFIVSPGIWDLDIGTLFFNIYAFIPFLYYSAGHWNNFLRCIFFVHLSNKIPHQGSIIFDRINP